MNASLMVAGWVKYHSVGFGLYEKYFSIAHNWIIWEIFFTLSIEWKLVLFFWQNHLWAAGTVKKTMMDCQNIEFFPSYSPFFFFFFFSLFGGENKSRVVLSSQRHAKDGFELQIHELSHTVTIAFVEIFSKVVAT